MIYAIAAVLVLIADQSLKYWVTVNIELNTGSITLIPGVLDLVNIHNTGAAFGLLDGGGWRWVFVVIALLFVVIAVYAIKRGLIKGAIGRWAVVGVLAGAIGNCIDRVLYGYVVDMFYPVFLDGTPFDAIFNVADVFISCCGILFCLYILFGDEYKTRRVEDEDEDVRPVKSARTRSVPGANRGGSHAKAPGGHVRSQNARRVPAREARSERSVEQSTSGAPAQERTRIPVQQPRPQQRRPAQAQQPRTVDPNDPFAEWERPQQPRQAQSAPARPSAQRSQAAPKSAAAPGSEQPRRETPPRSAAQPRPEAKPKGDYEFTLEEILAEFSDK